MSRWYVLIGEGIECEKEMARFLALPAFSFESVQWLKISDVLSGAFSTDQLRAGDGIALPGGFSFADHFGSGRLLAHELRQARFFESCAAVGVDLFGVCNGFQVLTEAGLFGRGVKLLPNKGFGFTNKWVTCRGLGPLEGQEYFIPVRHGEGCLSRAESQWASHVTPFLKYIDFDNGSQDQVAGLVATHGKSRVIGMMPHPEIAARDIDKPDTLGPEYPVETRNHIFHSESDGVKLIKNLLQATRKDLP